MHTGAFISGFQTNRVIAKPITGMLSSFMVKKSIKRVDISF